MDNPLHQPGRRGAFARLLLGIVLVIGIAALLLDWRIDLGAGNWPASFFFPIVVLSVVWILRLLGGNRWALAAFAYVLVTAGILVLAPSGVASVFGWVLLVFVAIVSVVQLWNIGKTIGPSAWAREV